MEPTLYQTVPILGAVAFAGGGLLIALRPTPASFRGAWLIPAALAGLFLAWSLLAIAREGLFAVWPEHVRNAWGVQIWLDLLLGIGSAFALIVPRARAVGMRPMPWFVAVACTGSVGLLAMLARQLYLAERAAPSPAMAQAEGTPA